MHNDGVIKGYIKRMNWPVAENAVGQQKQVELNYIGKNKKSLNLLKNFGGILRVTTPDNNNSNYVTFWNAT